MSKDLHDEESSSSDSNVELPDGWETHPMFLKRQPTLEEIESNPALKGIHSILYDGSTTEVMTTYKTQGNNALKVVSRLQKTGKKEGLSAKEITKRSDAALKEALTLYGKVLEVEGAPNPLHVARGEKEADEEMIELLSTTLSNRSEACRLLGLIGQGITDAKLAVRLRPTWFRPHFRIGRLLETRKDYAGAEAAYQQAWELSFKEEIRPALKRVREKKEEQEKKLAVETAAHCELYRTVSGKGIKLGRPLGLFTPSSSYPPFSRIGKTVRCTVYMLYPQYGTSDTITDVDLTQPLGNLLNIVFESPAEWDTEGLYRPSNLMMSFRTSWTDVLDAEGGVHKKGDFEHGKWRSADTSKSLISVLRSPSYVVPGAVVFFVLPKKGTKFTKRFLTYSKK
eukprot:gnl/Dysnectes_brevis/3353_a4219_1568.p1 GENE.gnl/Dysnectes_brevis/3353_a4219_1568~~gnl/Dysnectes_brevis/3353_a4219_1568.p1  ORF type:complete len:396 (-),score=69.47 gnl/Dysnectes_brevis/3353_a4219_1568:108-1295(-)